MERFQRVMNDVPAGVVEEARSLLFEGEASIPDAVLHTARFLAERGVWFRLARNPEAFSCRDASHKRSRLGHTGIPLWDELKSFLGRFEDSTGRQRYVVAHCRGDRRLNMERLADALGASAAPERLSEEELTRLGLRYGLVNPFETWKPFTIDGPLLSFPISQVFDRELLNPVGLPWTVMTNAGSLTWAVEFDAKSLVPVLDDASVADIAEADPEERPRPLGASKTPALAILTGNVPESGMALWQDVINHVRRMLGPDCLGDISMPSVIVHSLPALGLTMELDRRRDAIWRELRPAVEAVCKEGVQLLAIACNTTHHFTPEIREICGDYGVEFVSVAEVLADWLRAQGVNRLALIGIRFVADLGPWSAYRDPLAGFEVEVLSGRANERLEALAYQVKSEGVSEAGLSRLRDILREEVQSEHVVLALTELSLLLARQRKKGRSGKVLIDPLALYGEALACRFLGLPFPREVNESG